MPHCATFIEALRQRGYRITPQRELIISIIAHNGQHMTAEEIFEQVQQHTNAVNLATVYRVLDLLYAEGFVCRNDLGGGKYLYATIQHGPHIHLICRHCGHVLDADAALISTLGENLTNEYGFQADISHISIFGICSHCQKGETNP